mgnify:CR=1 FL=1
MDDYLVRLYSEHYQLHQKIDKLRTFVVSNKYDSLPDIDKSDLKEQLGYMESYFSVLSRRVSRHCSNA